MDEAFLWRTYRSAAVVTGIVLFFLASYGQFWALLPVLLGAALGIGLLYALDVFVRRTYTPERAGDADKKWNRSGPGRSLFFFALVKYPLVALLIWAVTRLGGTREVMAFAGGFILIQFVLFLRGIGRYITENQSENARSKDTTGDKE